jgi:hypothetical protein
MTFGRLPLLVSPLLLALVAAPAVHAKEGVRATLIGPVDLDARPGERITIAWKLEDTRGRPFGAGGLFVRLRSAAGGRPATAVTDGSGRFEVGLTVPKGGIGRIEFGLRGWRIAGGQTSRADVLFPLVNDPFARPPARRAGSSFTSPTAPADHEPLELWLAILAAVAVTSAIVGAGLGIRRASAN